MLIFTPNYEKIVKTRDVEIWGQKIKCDDTVCGDREYLSTGSGLSQSSCATHICMWCPATSDELAKFTHTLKYKNLENWRKIQQYHDLAIQTIQENSESAEKKQKSGKKRKRTEEEIEFEKAEKAREKAQQESQSNWLPPACQFKSKHNTKFLSENQSIIRCPVLPFLIDSLLKMIPDVTLHGLMRIPEWCANNMLNLSKDPNFQECLEKQLNISYFFDEKVRKLRISFQNEQQGVAFFNKITAELRNPCSKLKRFLTDEVFQDLQLFFDSLWDCLKLLRKRMSVDDTKLFLFKNRIVGILWYKLFPKIKVNHYIHDLLCHVPALVVFWKGNLREFAHYSVENAIKEKKDIFKDKVRRKKGTVAKQLLKESFFIATQECEDIQSIPDVKKIKKGQVLASNKRPKVHKRSNKKRNFEEKMDLDEDEMELDEQTVAMNKIDIDSPDKQVVSQDYSFPKLETQEYLQDAKILQKELENFKLSEIAYDSKLWETELEKIEKQISNYCQQDVFSNKIEDPASANFAPLPHPTNSEVEKKKAISKSSSKTNVPKSNFVKNQHQKLAKEKKEKENKANVSKEAIKTGIRLHLTTTVGSYLMKRKYEWCDSLIFESIIKSQQLEFQKLGIEVNVVAFTPNILAITNFKQELLDWCNNNPQKMRVNVYCFLDHYSVLITVVMDQKAFFLQFESLDLHKTFYESLDLNIVKVVGPRQRDSNCCGYFCLALIFQLKNYIAKAGVLKSKQSLLQFIENLQDVTDEEIEEAHKIYQRFR